MNGGFAEILQRVFDEVIDRLNSLDLRACVVREIERQLAGGDPAEGAAIAKVASHPGTGLKIVLHAAGLSDARRLRLALYVSQGVQEALREKLRERVISGCCCAHPRVRRRNANSTNGATCNARGPPRAVSSPR